MEREHPRRTRHRLVAALALLTFGCVTVRAPASAIPAEVPLAGGRAAPQLELWLEGNRTPAPAEVKAAADQARAALDAALEGRDPGDGWILVARARGVTRTEARRHEQVAATVGLVVGAVVIVALVVLAVVGGKGKGGGGGGGGSLARVGRPPAPTIRPPSVHLRPPPPLVFGHGTRHGSGPGWDVRGDVAVELSAPPLPEEERLAWREVPAEAPLADQLDEGAPVAADGAQDGPAPSAPSTLRLPPPPSLPVDARGYFDGDALEVELTLVDPDTGQAVWRKVARGEVDPRDRAAVKKLVDPLLTPEGWVPVDPPAGAPPT